MDQRATSHQAYNLILPAGVVQQGRCYSNSLRGTVEDLLVAWTARAAAEAHPNAERTQRLPAGLGVGQCVAD
jgi:hypothetical protein